MSCKKQRRRCLLTLAAPLLHVPGADRHSLDVAPAAECDEAGGVGNDILLLQLNSIVTALLLQPQPANTCSRRV